MAAAETPPPPQNNPGADLMKFVKGMNKALPDVFRLEQAYRPQFGELNKADIASLLGGSNGLLALGGQTTGASQEQIEAARAKDFANMGANTGSVLDILRGVSPQAAAALDSQSQMAQTAYDRAQGPLSFQERRGADQQAREAFASRGRVNDNASVVGEILGREDVMQAKRAEASQLGAQAFGMGQQFSNPALALLGGTPNSVLLGQDYLNMGRGAVGANMPQLIDTGAGMQLGAQNNANTANWQSSVASAKNAANATNTQAAASALGSVASILGAVMSDKRVKTDIKEVGKTKKGLPIYTYKYKGDPKTQMGVMAQDVKKKQPKALGPTLGDILTVNYAEIN